MTDQRYTDNNPGRRSHDVLSVRIDNLELAVHEIRDSTKSIAASMQTLATVEARHEGIMQSIAMLQARNDKQGEAIDALAASDSSTKTTVAAHSKVLGVVASTVTIGFIGALWKLL